MATIELPDTTPAPTRVGAKLTAWTLAFWAFLVLIGAGGLALVQDSGHLLPHRVCVAASGSDLPPRCFERGDFDITVNY